MGQEKQPGLFPTTASDVLIRPLHHLCKQNSTFLYRTHSLFSFVPLSEGTAMRPRDGAMLAQHSSWHQRALMERKHIIFPFLNWICWQKQQLVDSSTLKMDNWSSLPVNMNRTDKKTCILHRLQLNSHDVCSGWYYSGVQLSALLTKIHKSDYIPSYQHHWLQVVIDNDSALTLSFRSKYWLHSETAVEKCARVDWLCINNSVPSTTRFDLSRKNKGRIMAQRQRVCHCTAKTGRGIVFPRSPSPDNSGTTGITVETLDCKRKNISADGGGRGGWRRRKICSHVNACSRPYHWDMRQFKYTIIFLLDQ